MNNLGPVVTTLWSAHDQIRSILDYKKKLVISAAAPPRPITSGWTFYIFDGKWTDEYQTVLGQTGRKVILTERNGAGAGYCLISERLNLVLREEVRTLGQTKESKITELTLNEPAQDVLRIPADFTRREEK